MREIKFRAWDGKHKQMLNNPYGDDYICEGTPINDIFANPYDGHIYMQFTGLKDKNGVEIYEGDLVSWQGEPYTVVFKWGCFCVKEGDGNLLGHVTDDGCEVIGNIYENPGRIKEAA